MRKKIVNEQNAYAVADASDIWKDLSALATVEVTSEDPLFPIESAFRESGSGWRASRSGAQQIRLVFDEPVSLQHIRLRFEELTITRTQEFCLSWSDANRGRSVEIIRQQWNFSPHGSTFELEDYSVNLENVGVLELAIFPDISGGPALASLASFLVK